MRVSLCVTRVCGIGGRPLFFPCTRRRAVCTVIWSLSATSLIVRNFAMVLDSTMQARKVNTPMKLGHRTKIGEHQLPDGGLLILYTVSGTKQVRTCTVEEWESYVAARGYQMPEPGTIYLDTRGCGYLCESAPDDSKGTVTLRRVLGPKEVPLRKWMRFSRSVVSRSTLVETKTTTKISPEDF